MSKSCIFMRFSTILTALFFPYIAHEQTVQNLDFVSSLVALFLIERHGSQNQGLLKSEERLSDFKEQCAQLWLFIFDSLIVEYVYLCVFHRICRWSRGGSGKSTRWPRPHRCRCSHRGHPHSRSGSRHNSVLEKGGKWPKLRLKPKVRYSVKENSMKIADGKM